MNERDLPDRLLRTGGVLFGGGRPEWSAGMQAELAHVSGTRARWAFALGCLRTLALAPPATGRLLALIGAISGVMASAGLVVLALVRYPGIITGPGSWVAVALFGIALVGYVVAALGSTSRLDSGPLTIAVLGGVVIAASWFVVGLDASLGGPGWLSLAMVGLAPAAAVALGMWAKARSGSALAALSSVVLAGIVGGLVLFLAWAGTTVLTGGRPYDAGLLRDFHSSGATDLATYAVNDSLGSAMMLLLLVPLVTLVAGAVGVALSRGSRRPVVPLQPTGS